MKKSILFLVLINLLFLSAAIPNVAYHYKHKPVMMEDFDNFPPDLHSWQSWDSQPEAWEFTTDFGYNDSNSALHLSGTTAKLMKFYPVTVDTGDIWQAAVYIESVGDTIGIGFCDDFNVLYYSIAGEECLNIEEWVTCYQGIYPLEEWHEINFPVADDWLARFDYLPRLKGIVFVNNCDSNGEVYFDEIKNMTTLLPQAPAVSIDYEILADRRINDNLREVEISFSALVQDDDSHSFNYQWQLGDSTEVDVAQFEHTYTVTDDHAYSVILKVTDDTALEGYANCLIDMEEGASSFPLTMNFTGDIILARDIGTHINYYGYESLIDPTIELLGNACDITVANLECPLTDSYTHHPTKTIYFKGQEDHAEALSYAGIDLVTLANNHILDYMEEGITDTQAALDAEGVLYSGAGLNSYEAYRPLLYNRKGVNLAFLASSDRTGQYNNYQPYLNAGYDKSGFAYLTKYYMQKQINEVRDVSDLVIMELHCGSEYSTSPGSNYDSYPLDMYLDPNPEDENYNWRLDIPQAWDMEYRHFAVDAGADLVICHHPHIIQGFEVYNGVLIAHSLGNFMFDLSYPETFPTCILYSEISEEGFNRFYVKPCYIDDDITLPAEGELGLYILDHLAQKSRDLGSYIYVDRENIKAEIILDTLTMPIYSHELSQTSQLELRDEHYTTGPVLLDKIGSFASLNSINEDSDWEFRLGREIVYHGNFEDEGCSEWNINSSHEWLTDENPYMGENCLCIQVESSYGDNIITNLEGRIKVYDDLDYSLHGYIRTDNCSDAQVQIRTYNSRTGGNYINMYGTPPLNGDIDQWTYVWQDLPQIEDNENFIDYRSTTYPPDSGDSHAYFDNVGLIGWEEWQSFDGNPIEVASPNEYYYIEIRSTEDVESIDWTYTEKNYGFMPQIDNLPIRSQLPHAQLLPNYPNPFNPITKFSFNLNQPAMQASINVYNIKGQKLRSLPIDISRGSGNYQVIWNGKNSAEKAVGSGVYFYRLMINNQAVDQGKCLLLK